MAAGLGFEPRHTAPKTVVLPLDYPAQLDDYTSSFTVPYSLLIWQTPPILLELSDSLPFWPLMGSIASLRSMRFRWDISMVFMNMQVKGLWRCASTAPVR